MKISLALLMMIMIQNCHLDGLPSDVNKIYILNREKDFSKFENWNIYLREGKNDVYIFDRIQDDSIKARYLLLDRDSVVYKKVVSGKITEFRSLEKDSLREDSKKGTLNLNLYLDFKSLKVDAIYYHQEQRLFRLKKGKISLLRARGVSDTISNKARFINYKKIDSHWSYYKDE